MIKDQSVMSRSREFPFPGILHFFDGIGTGIEKIWYREKSQNRNWKKNLVPKKVSESVSKNFGTEKKYWNQSRNFSRILVLIWVPVSSRSRDFCNFLWYRNRSRKKFGAEKSLGTGLEKKKSTEKSLGIGLEKFWYRKKVSESVSFRF